MTKRLVYWHGEIPEKDPFGEAYNGVMFDARMRDGQWANLSRRSWMNRCLPLLGTGLGQMYEKQADGRWLKTEG